jgi:hypothetical protein
MSTLRNPPGAVEALEADRALAATFRSSVKCRT